LAYSMIKKSIAINPQFYKSLFNMGVVYKRLNNHEKSLEYYNKAKEYNPKYHYIYLNMSAIYIEDKEYLKSIEILTEGINNNPEAHDLYYNRACSYALLVNEDLAIKDIRKALILNPSLIKWVIKDKDFYCLYDNEEFNSIVNQYS